MTKESKKITLITGANQGIGLHVAKELATNGHRVLLGSRNLANGIEAANQIGENVEAIQLDVTDGKSIANAVEHVKQKFGRLDMLINNAAISNTRRTQLGISLMEYAQISKASNASMNEIRTVWDTNVFGVLALSQAMLPLLLQSASARIINVSSGVGSLTLNSNPASPYRVMFKPGYAASKTALNAITLSFAIELENTNVSVIAVSPGFTKTNLNGFEGVETIEEGSKSIVHAALAEKIDNGTFIGPDGIMPW